MQESLVTHLMSQSQLDEGDTGCKSGEFGSR